VVATDNFFAMFQLNSKAIAKEGLNQNQKTIIDGMHCMLAPLKALP